LCFADRTNLAFAALQLNKTLGFSEQVYGIGSSIFFISYAGLQIPSNVGPSPPFAGTNALHSSTIPDQILLTFPDVSIQRFD
jgi:hypothetical protein